LREKKITHKQIQDRLEGIIDRVTALYHNKDINRLLSQRLVGGPKVPEIKEEPVIEGKYKVTSIGTLGFQHCPFGGCTSRARGSNDYTITNLKTGCSIRFGELITHLIGVHEFFEGKGTSYRLDPEKLLQVIEIDPAVDYKVEYETITLWSEKRRSPLEYTHPEAQSQAERENLGVHKLKSLTAYELPYDDYEKYKHRNLAKEQFYRQIQGYDEQFIQDIEEPNKPVWEDTGERYLHVFVKKNTREVLAKDAIVAGARFEGLSREIKTYHYDEHLIFKKEQAKYAVLGPDDKMVKVTSRL